MKALKKLFPMAFTVKEDVATIIIDVIIHALAFFLFYILGDLMDTLGTFGIILRVIFYGIDTYLVISVVMSFLHFFKVIK